MWVCKIKLKPDCTIANRCQKYKCSSYSLPLTSWEEKGFRYTSHRHTLLGTNKNIIRFIEDLKKDKRVVKVETVQDTLFVVERRKKGDIPTSHYNSKMFFAKPVFVDTQGFEEWETASWDKKVLIEFVGNLKKEKGMTIMLKKVIKTKLDSIHFPSLLPKLSPKQKQAYQLALQQGYYEYPRRMSLQKLAELSNVTVATFQEHLRKAEAKIMSTKNQIYQVKKQNSST